MPFDYEKSIWGKSEAGLNWSNPTAIRLSRLLRILVKENEGGRVLEVGSGAGAFIRALKRLRPDLNCSGADISSQAVNYARSLNDGVDYKVCTDSSLPYEDGSFDVVFFFDVLEHVSWPENFLNEIGRVLKAGGKLFIYVPCEADILSAWNFLDKFGLKKDITKNFAGHINFFSRRNVLNILDRSGFRVAGKSYSEHFLGQILGLAAFFGMRRKSKKTGETFNNEKFFAELGGQNKSWFSILKKLINSLVSLESFLFSRVPSPNLFVEAVKK